MDSNSVLAIQGLTKTYGTTVAVSDITFSVARGEVVGLVGPNGAGKTSTISMVLGVLTPTSGSIHVAGIDVAAKRSEALSHVNFAAVYAQLPGNLTVEQNLRVFGLMYDVPDLTERIADVVEALELKSFLRTRAGLLSSGEQTRVGLAKAMLSNPELLLLDEPTASLDPSTARTIRQIIKDYAASGKGGVLWTSHNMQEVTEVCDRVLFLSRGKIILQGDPKLLPQEHNQANLEELFITLAREPLSLELN